MNTIAAVYASMIVLVAAAGPVRSATDREGVFLGVLLDGRPLPEILFKHLNLKRGNGLRIENIFEDSPADRAGLDRDDILLSLDGRDVNDPAEFGRSLLQKGVGKTAVLEVMHAGQKRTVEVALATGPQRPRLKYPPDPRAMFGWRMGGIFRHDPESGRWVPFDELMDPNGSIPPLPFPREVYSFEYGQGTERVTVTIEGNPQSQSTKVTVRTAQAEYTSTVGEVERLPEAYREQVRQALRRAIWEGMWSRGFGPRGGQRRRDARPRDDDQPGASLDSQLDSWERATQRMLDSISRYLEKAGGPARPMDQGELERLNQIEQQLRQLQEKIDQLQSQRPH